MVDAKAFKSTQTSELAQQISTTLNIASPWHARAALSYQLLASISVNYTLAQINGNFKTEESI